MSDTQNQIKEMVETSPVFLFMKGTPDFPQCGFSNQAVSILNHLNVPFQSFNVLDNMDIRSGIKEYAQWPTIPQLYIKGTFVGGSDLMMEMYQSGELDKLLQFEES